MSELTLRVLFAIVAAPVTIWILLNGGAPLAGLLAVSSALAAWEFFRIAGAAGHRPLMAAGVLVSAVLPLLVHAHYLAVFSAPVALWVVTLLVLCAVALFTRGVADKPLAAVAVTLFGVAYTGGTLSFAYALRYHELVRWFEGAPGIGRVMLSADPPVGFTVPLGGMLLLLPVLLTWATDIGAYFFGRLLGRRKLMPSVSPGKTVAGAVGGVVTAVLVCWLLVATLLRPVGQMTLTAAGIVAFALAVSVAAQVGDLFESLLKREAGVKHSSRIIPGHGGVLDRVDSLLFVLPVAYLLIGALLVAAPR
jgi:phosphatidate cytidylyltransferase